MRTRSILLSALFTHSLAFARLLVPVAPVALSATVLMQPQAASAHGFGMMFRLERDLDRLEALNNSRPRDEFYFHIAKCIGAIHDRIDDIRLGRKSVNEALSNIDDTLYGLMQYNQAGRFPYVAQLSARIDFVAQEMRATIASRGTGYNDGGYRPAGQYYTPPSAPVYNPPPVYNRPDYVPPPAPAYVPPPAPCDGASRIGYRSW